MHTHTKKKFEKKNLIEKNLSRQTSKRNTLINLKTSYVLSLKGKSNALKFSICIYYMQPYLTILSESIFKA